MSQATPIQSIITPTRLEYEYQVGGAHAEFVIGAIDGLEIGVCDQRVLAEFQAVLAGQLHLVPENNLDSGKFGQALLVALGEVLASPIDAKALCSAFTKAKKAGIPMMSIARGSACKDQLLHISADEIGVGSDIATWTAKKIGGKGKVAMLAGPAGAQAFQNFAKGYEQGLALVKALHSAFASIGDARMPSTPLAIRSLGPLSCVATLPPESTTLTLCPSFLARIFMPLSMAM